MSTVESLWLKSRCMAAWKIRTDYSTRLCRPFRRLLFSCNDSRAGWDNTTENIGKREGKWKRTHGQTFTGVGGREKENPHVNSHFDLLPSPSWRQNPPFLLRNQNREWRDTAWMASSRHWKEAENVQQSVSLTLSSNLLSGLTWVSCLVHSGADPSPFTSSSSYLSHLVNDPDDPVLSLYLNSRNTGVSFNSTQWDEVDNQTEPHLTLLIHQKETEANIKETHDDVIKKEGMKWIKDRKIARYFVSETHIHTVLSHFRLLDMEEGT